MKNKDNWIGLIGLTLFVIVGAAIVLPVINAARPVPPSRECRSNLRQLGQAIQVYCEDNDERFPLNMERAGSLYAALFPYAKSNAVFLCPLDPGQHTASRKSPYEREAEKTKEISYRLNPLLAGLSLSTRSFPEGANTILFFEREPFHAQSPDNSANINALTSDMSIVRFPWPKIHERLMIFQASGTGN